MQNNLFDLLRVEHIVVGVRAKDAQDAIRQLTGVLTATGHVEPEFADDVWRREQTFPTGLPTEPLAVAIPHADPDHVHSSAVSLGVLDAPVLFGQMGTDGSTRLEAHLIFLLAIKEREKQVEMIQQLVTLIQTGSLLAGLTKAKDPAQAIALIHKALD